jgi:hypothetical protein
MQSRLSCRAPPLTGVARNRHCSTTHPTKPLQPDLEYIPLIIVGLFLLVLVARAKRKRKHIEQQQPQPAAPAPITHPTPEIIGPRELVPLAAQLHHIENAFAPFAANSAHPSELRQHPDFKQGVTLLADASVPLETALQYALGAN